MWIDSAQLLESPYALAVFAICAIGIIVAGVIAGATSSQDNHAIKPVRRPRSRATAMRTANSSVIEAQTRKLQREVP